MLISHSKVNKLENVIDVQLTNTQILLTNTSKAYILEEIHKIAEFITKYPALMYYEERYT